MFYSHSFIHQLYPSKAGTSRRGSDQSEGPCWNVITTSGSPLLAPLLGSDSGYPLSLPDCLSQTCPWGSYTGEGRRNSDGLPGESLCLASPLLAECPDVSSEVLVFWPHSQRCLCFPFSYFLNLNLRLSHTDGVYIDHTYPLSSPSSFS